MKKIQHCSTCSIASVGGIESYLNGLLISLPEIYDPQIVNSLDDIDQSQSKLLHVHDAALLKSLNNQCPAVYTLHNHNIYCPSGSKYLSNQKAVCDRQMSLLGCTWGHLIDGCGSRRPQTIINNLSRAYGEFAEIKGLGITAIANSDYVRSQLIANGLPASQVVTVRCGIAKPSSPHLPLEKPIHDRQHIFFAGRIVPEKGLDWLLRTMPRLDARIHLDIAGEGWAMPQVRKLAEDLDLGDRITWHGWCQREQLENLYCQSFAVIFPSVWPEPAGLVTLESYARFRAVIASAVGGIPEHLEDGKTGILVEPHNIEQLAATITDLANNFDKARAIGIAGNELFHAEFTLDIHAQRLEAIYELAIAKFHARSSSASSYSALRSNPNQGNF
ncbi:glycosyltransferase family 4 protein [Pseudanabaena sp. UWO310]|uniref:glycosyltransferase family 4 protein n=1 Tax=Pseudanabaena sp. UWO310 TaxID=2480795 RepID=UPI00115BF298|nr:glycosyltransferase family 4 protein [Pseudanabaena sp. UWO310]TYQ31077.1 glycosyltransferase family 4 protein [Pseudanabaena sp. UWO310]